MKKRLVKLLVCCLMCTFLVACQSSKKEVNSSYFISTMESKGLTCEDALSQFDDTIVSNVTIASDDFSKYQIEFYQFKNEEDAKNSYITNETNIKDVESSSSKVSHVSATVGNYSEYALTTDSQYMYTERVGNTLIYAFGDLDSKSLIEKHLGELGYK